MDLVDFSSRKILVTGASSGIGRAVAVLLSKLGAMVVLCGRNEERLQETRNIMDNPEQHRCFSFDIRDYGQYEDIFRQIVSDEIKLQGMVCCAGIAKAVPLRVMKQQDILEMLEVNFISFMELTKMYAKKKYSNGGSIVAVSAANVYYPQKCMSIYAASKAALEAGVRTLALELVSQSIRVNCVIPGAIRTEMMNNTQPEELQSILSKQLMGAGNPEDVANMIAFLLSDAASFVTGRAMFIDGGMLGQ